ncbi:MAG: hypothetical protein K6F75_05800 [Butyrivibrio sp.]|nr:hypothetical protein [Butyrivibrio sp.]
MKRVLAGILAFSIFFGCIHGNVYASDFIQESNLTSTEESSDDVVIEIPDETPAKASGGASVEEEIDEETETNTGADQENSSAEGSTETEETVEEEVVPSDEENPADNPGENSSEEGPGSVTIVDEEIQNNGKAPELSIIRQSENAFVFLGEKVSFFVETTAANPKYKWYYSKDEGETWLNCRYDGYDTGCISFEVQSFQYGYKFKCVVKDDSSEVVSNIFTINERATRILDQSHSVEVNVGETASLSVKAEGNRLSYRWYYSADGGRTWRKTVNYALVDAEGNKSTVPYEGSTEDTLSFTTLNVHYSYLFKCAVTDRAKNVIESEYIALKSSGPVITEQPKDEYHLIGEKATFHVASESEGVSYQWYFSKDNGVNWYKCSYTGGKTDTLSFDVQQYQYGFRFRCEVKDGSGKSITSSECTLIEKETTVSLDSKEIETKKGENVKISVTAEGNKLSYRWYYSKDAGKTWSKCTNYKYIAEDGTVSKKTYEGYAGSTLSFVAQEEHFDMLFRCLVTDRKGTQYITENVIVKMSLPELIILEQPKDFYGLLNEEAIISVKAEGTSLKYTWYYCKTNGTTWSKCFFNGYKTNTISFPIKSYQYGYKFYCVVEDKLGNKVESDIATILEKKTQIISEPEDIICEPGTEIDLVVKAEGNSLTYLWHRSEDNGETWEPCSDSVYAGASTYKLSFTATEETGRYIYRCEITDRLLEKTYSRAVSVEVQGEKQCIWLGDVDLEANESIIGLEELVGSEYIKENAVIGESGGRIALTLTPKNIKSGNDFFLLHFFARSDVKNSDIRIRFNNNGYTGNYSVPTYMTEYILPIKGISSISKLVIDTVDAGQKIQIGNLEILSSDGKNILEFNLGVFDRDEDFKTNLVNEKSSVGYQAVDLLSDGKYLYSLGRGELIIYSLESEKREVIGAVYGVGNAREMFFCNGGNAIVVSSRENGIFTIDISDKTNPCIMAEVASEGLSTGLCVQDNYCFVTSRRYGVEIYDISDISNPVFISLISGYNEEFYDCSISGKYLYVSSWAEKKISVFDIQNVASPSKVTEFNVGGHAGGTVIRDSLLYIATGYHSTDSSSNIASPGYGMGNGMDIYDISNPSSPKRISSTKIDGRYYYSGFDHWNVEISGNYAFYSNAYTGVHIIDISNPYAPKKLSNIVIDIPATSKNFKAMTLNPYLLPYDSAKYSRAIVTSVAVVNGGIYFGSNSGHTYYGGTDISSAMGLYYLPIEGLTVETIDNATCDYEIDDKNSDDITYTVEGFEIRETAKGEDIWSVCNYNGRYYCATGKKEVVVLDNNYEVVERHETSGVTKDAVVVGDFLYVAESSAGLGVYYLKDGAFEKTGSVIYDSYASVFTTVNVFDDDYLLAQVSWTRYALICISDPTNPKIVENINAGSMYDRSLLGQTGRSKYQSVFGRTYLYWYEASESGRPKIIKKFTSPKYAEQNGIAYGNGYAVTIYGNGYIYYDPKTITQGEYDKLSAVKVAGVKLRGMPNIRDNMMVVTNCFGREITIVDIEDIDKPVLLAKFSVNGNPDEVYAEEDGKYIIPLRHGGIMEISIK